MYKYSVETILNEKNLTRIIEAFKQNETPRFNRLESYYRSKNVILERVIGNNKPNNKLVHGFARYITNMATGYFMGKGIRYEIEGDSYKEHLNKIFDKNYTHNINFEVAKEASKKGIAFELMYIDEKSVLRAKKFSAEDIIPIYSQRIGEFLECAIRIWTVTDINGKAVEYADVYTDTEKWSYSRAQGDPIYRLNGKETHMLGDIPVIVYWNNEEQTGDYEDVITLINAYDKAQSDTANDFEYFTDAYLVITGAGGGFATDSVLDYDAEGDGQSELKEQESLAQLLKKERMLFLDEKGQAEWLVKTINDTAQENYKNRLYDNIFFLSQVPALSDKSFSGNLTGVAIKYKLIGLDELFVVKENKFMSAQKKKIKIITEFINTKENKNYDADTVEIKFERNVIENLKETIENVASLEGIVSRETQLGLLPFVKDVNTELDKINEEELKREGLAKIPVDFGFDGL